MKGPIPKRSDKRLGHGGKSRQEVTKAPAGPVFDPPPASKSWHPLMIEWYESLSRSGQAQFLEESDYAVAQIAAYSMSQEIASGAVSAAMLREFMSVAGSLLSTEGDRRRLRVELERVEDVEESRREDVEATAVHYLNMFESG